MCKSKGNEEGFSGSFCDECEFTTDTWKLLLYHRQQRHACKYLLRRCQEFSELLIWRPLFQRLLRNINLYSKTSLGFLAKKTTCKFAVTPIKKSIKKQFMQILIWRLPFRRLKKLARGSKTLLRFYFTVMALQEASDTLNLLEEALHHVEEIQEDDVSSVDIRRMLREISLVFKPSLGFQSSAVVFLQAASGTFKMMEMIKKGASLEWLRRILGRGRP